MELGIRKKENGSSCVGRTGEGNYYSLLHTPGQKAIFTGSIDFYPPMWNEIILIICQLTT